MRSARTHQLAVGGAGQVDRQHVEVGCAGEPRTPTRGRRKAGLAKTKGGRESGPAGEEFLRTIEIFEEEIEDLRALDDASLDESATPRRG